MVLCACKWRGENCFWEIDDESDFGYIETEVYARYF